MPWSLAAVVMKMRTRPRLGPDPQVASVAVRVLCTACARSPVLFWLSWGAKIRRLPQGSHFCRGFLPHMTPSLSAIGEASFLKNQRVTFAHSDWAGYSVFEEAFALGHAAGRVVD